ncbi:MAG TPA: ABC transporter permease [Chthonomonadaceae bacterium]|nr:ABC transporter permease [Chthonomonadaceae bacterium]
MDITTPNTTKPHLVIRPSKGWQALNLRELWRFRDLFFSLAERDVKLRYRQTALGVIWVVIQPLIAAGIFSFVFGRVARLPSDGVPYLVFSYAGLLGWNAFQNTVTKASASLVQNQALISKTFFPRILLPLSLLCSTLIDFGVALIMMGVLMAVYGIAPTAGLLLLPVWLLLILMLAAGIGLYASAVAVTYRDVLHVVPVAMQMLLYASPIAYSVTAVPARWHALYMLNPLSGLLEGFRWSLLGRGPLPLGSLAYAAVVSLGVLLAGAIVFQKMERRFADVV